MPQELTVNGVIVTGDTLWYERRDYGISRRLANGIVVGVGGSGDVIATVNHAIIARSVTIHPLVGEWHQGKGWILGVEYAEDQRCALSKWLRSLSARSRLDWDGLLKPFCELAETVKVKIPNYTMDDLAVLCNHQWLVGFSASWQTVYGLLPERSMSAAMIPADLFFSKVKSLKRWGPVFWLPACLPVR